MAEKCDTRAARVVAARLGFLWRKSKQVERAACDRLLVDMGTVLQYRDELAEIGPVLTKLAHLALQQQLASLTAMVADHETAILELERQVASLALRHQPPWRRWVTSLGPCSMSSSSLSFRWCLRFSSTTEWWTFLLCAATTGTVLWYV